MSFAVHLSPSARRALAFAGSLALAGLIAGSALAAGPGPSGARHVGGLAKGGKGPSLLIDHGGPVLPSSKMYSIFWGSFTSGSELVGAMDSLLGGMNGSSYLGIAQQYMRGASISSSYGGHVFDASAPPKTAPKASALGAEVAKVYGAPVQDALYVVFTSNLPHISYCAWHDRTTANGVPIEVAYIPLQPAGCSPLGSVNLHANAYSEATQAAADSVAHEFIETVTDPKLNAWYDANGFEIADKCEYDYQAIVTLHNHSTWQIQSEWSNALAACQQQ
jgi:hypothetical protein